MTKFLTASQMRPRIFRERGEWACWGGLFCRRADTPRAAYWAWHETYERNRRIYAPSSDMRKRAAK